MTLALMAKAFTLSNTTPTKHNQRSSSNPSNMQIIQTCMNMDQDRQMLMVKDNVGNQFRPNAVQNFRNQVVHNAIQNPSIHIVKNMNGLSVVSKIANQYGNRNVVTAPAEGNDAYEETERVKANCILENNLQQASTSGIQSNKAPVYDSDESTEVHLSKNCNDNDIFNMYTQEEQYTELLEPILEPHQVPQNDSNVIFEVSSMEQEADESLAKNKALELEIERLFRAIASQDIMSIVQTNSVVDTSNLQTELERLLNKWTPLKVFPKVGESNALSKPVTSNSTPSSRESTVVNNERVIALRIFRINLFKASRYMNGMKYRTKNQSENVLKSANQKKHKANVKKLKKSGSKESLASPSKPRSFIGGYQLAWKVYSVISSTNYSNGENQVVSKSSAITTADASDKPQQQQDSTSSTSTLTTTIPADGNFNL
uniref:Uncharacterized protein n=1 Tax=Tanacetum cinerariifolium TaxID=118510 RepID=A0A6L2NLV1_TANCI|nr:hypothetical protein [Tanacetum cinerariifolium]